MDFNLLKERWLPVVCEDGSRRKIAPWELTTAPRPVDLDIPRPDFRGAMLEFLIGLVQTAMPPANAGEWEERLDSPPAPEALREAFTPLSPFFNLFGDRPRFMQDLTLSSKEVKEATPVSFLLIEAPTGKTLRDNGDFFVKRGLADGMCPACAGMALYTLQTYAPAGGVGNRTSLRGGGPLTTLVKGKTLWETVVGNVRPSNAVDAAPLPQKEQWGEVFPWGAPTRTSEKKGSEVYPADGNRLQAHWGMPRRVVLMPETFDTDVRCEVCGETCRTVVREYISKNYGANYGDTWRHPLSPYRSQGPGKPTLPVKGLSDGTAYTHWLGLVYGAEEKGKGVTPARSVDFFCKENEDGNTGSILAFGYAMDNMKPLMWCEGEYPVYPLADESLLEEFRRQVGMCIAAADRTRSTLISCLKKALFADEGRNASASQSLFEEVSRLFWAKTQADFYAIAERFSNTLADEEELTALRLRWAKILQRQAEALFDHFADSGAVEINARTLMRVQKVRHELLAFVISGNRKALELPKPDKGRTAS